MKKSLLRGKSFSPLFLVFFLFLSCGVFMGLKLRIEQIPRKKVPGSSIIYIPTGKFLKFATFGYSSFFADLIYLWAIQYYSDYSIPDRFHYLDHIFSIISELDPHYVDPYEIGSLIAVYEARDLNSALKILDRGLEKNPDQWLFPLEAGHLAQIFTKDYNLAKDYYRKAMGIKGAPDLTKRLYANAAFRTMDFKTSWETWLEIYTTVNDERIKKIASNHLYQVKAAIDVLVIKEAIGKFRAKFRRNPSELSQLVKAGYLASLPKDFDGQDYLYDPLTGEVKPTTIPWKR